MVNKKKVNSRRLSKKFRRVSKSTKKKVVRSKINRKSKKSFHSKNIKKNVNVSKKITKGGGLKRKSDSEADYFEGEIIKNIKNICNIKSKIIQISSPDMKPSNLNKLNGDLLQIISNFNKAIMGQNLGQRNIQKTQKIQKI